MPTGELTEFNLLSENVLLLNIARARDDCYSITQEVWIEGFWMFVAFLNKRSSQESIYQYLFSNPSVDQATMYV